MPGTEEEGLGKALSAILRLTDVRQGGVDEITCRGVHIGGPVDSAWVWVSVSVSVSSAPTSLHGQVYCHARSPGC